MYLDLNSKNTVESSYIGRAKLNFTQAMKQTCPLALLVSNQLRINNVNVVSIL